MKVRFVPDGGKFGYGFNYYCIVCGYYCGNSSDDYLVHITHRTHWFKKVPIDCPHVGERYAMPKHQAEVVVIVPQVGDADFIGPVLPKPAS